jgi:trk system potassium uptake protein TrkH
MRYKAYLQDRYRAMLGYSGEILIVLGLLHLVPLLLIPFYPAEVSYAYGFLIAGVPPLVIGLLARRRFFPKESVTLSVQEGAVIVAVIWLIAITVGALPFMTIKDTTFWHGWFESASGWTGTGISVLNAAETPRIILFFRSFTQLAGGAGFIIIALTAAAGALGTGLSAAEGRTDQLAPHVRQSALIVLAIYTGYTVFGVLALRIAGMGWFDAVNHAFSAVSTGGFSTKAQSVAYWDSALIEFVLIVLMLMGSINFFIAYTAIRGKLRAFIRSGEVRLMIGLIVLSSVLLIVLVKPQLGFTLDKSIRVAVFETVSALTTTGLATVDYRPWADFGWMALILLMTIGGGVGTTSGGIKLLRVYVLIKAVVWEFKRAFMPAHMVNEPAIWQGDRRELLSDRQVRQTALFVTLCLGILLAGTGLFTAYGFPLKESFFEFASSLAGAGMSVGVSSASNPPVLLMSQGIAMLLGRLEFFTLLIGLAKLLGDGRTLAGLKRQG